MLLSAVAGAAGEPAPQKYPTNDWAFIENGQLRLGVKKSSGACIAYLSRSGSERNLINHWDRGRLVQQSYYGARDGSMWGTNRWTWNPVQGGDCKGKPAKVLELKAGPDWLYARTQPKHWASGVDLPEVSMEEWITLTGHVAHVRFKMAYHGTQEHPVRDHEIPAFFVEPDLDTLILYDGSEPWTGAAMHRSRPGWPNESRRITEHWAAYVGTNDFGIGAYVPVADRLTCYRFGDGRADHGACSYFAPLTKFAITPGLVFEYDLYLAIGGANEIRDTFRRLDEARRKP
jgi:hypothetical protein